jgi:hypothetical protein
LETTKIKEKKNKNETPCKYEGPSKTFNSVNSLKKYNFSGKKKIL